MIEHGVDNTIPRWPAHTEAWVCERPPWGARYRVMRDEWLKDNTLRVIYAIQVTGAERSNR